MSKRVHWRLWERKYRPACKVQFESREIQQCELRFPDCKGGNFLSFAHSLKRADIYTKEQIMEVILTCNNCHGIIEGRILDKRI
ncbi:MAG: hypothetical protein WBP82_12085, partial [Leuconostoc mesenteroides]